MKKVNPKTYRCIGVMTGNSLDAVDVVITEFTDRTISDIGGVSLPIPQEMAQRFRNLKQALKDNGGDIEALISSPALALNRLIDDYTALVATAVKQALNDSGFSSSNIDAIGFHGQTCAHLPPSVARSTNPQEIYTLQVGDGQMLADLTSIPVVFDFRSDDLMNGGEGAPLAPLHNRHLAQNLQTQKIFPVVFCNGGNTGNLALISQDSDGREIVCGFDTGPFNHFIDFLARTERQQACDFNGRFGQDGHIDFGLLRRLFDTAVQTRNGDNYLLQPPPKSSDPSWYQIIPELQSSSLPFADRIRTAEFFSAYIFVYSLRYLPAEVLKPHHFLVFGGGWHNPLVMNDFTNLLHGQASVLPEHQEIFAALTDTTAQIAWSDTYGISGKYMEARIFADMAKCFLNLEPFTLPTTTGCRTPTVCGVIAYPSGNNKLRWSRAAKGWNR